MKKWDFRGLDVPAQKNNALDMENIVNAKNIIPRTTHYLFARFKKISVRASETMFNCESEDCVNYSDLCNTLGSALSLVLAMLVSLQ